MTEPQSIRYGKKCRICLRTVDRGFPRLRRSADVEELKEFLREHGFDRVGIFTYSHEEGTSGHGFEDDVPAAEKQRRAEEIMEVQQESLMKGTGEKMGKVFKTLIDKKKQDITWAVRSSIR